jgi:large subunit ribosomal protein L9
MKIIFLQDVRGVAKKYDVKEVSDGYARNFLLPQNLAEPATAAAMKKIEKFKESQEREDHELEKRLHEIAKTLSDTALQFEMEADEHGSIFGSINKEAILKALRDHKFIANERVEIDLEQPIKKVGEYVVPIDLRKGISVKLKISVKKKA